MTEESKDAGDASALAGLRRMVVHARDGLKSSIIGPSWNYSSDAWSPAKVRQYARMLLAVETLTLVADCLPADGGLSADEAQQLTQDHAARIAELERALSAEHEARTDAEAAMQEALDQAEELDGWREDVMRFRELARTDVKALVDAVMADAGMESDTPVR